jgi:folate-binding protein YgfZ
MPSEVHGSLRVVAPGDVPAAAEDALLDGALVAPASVFAADVTGPEVMQCIQGLHTNDVEAAGPAAFVYGATLSPKGMIVSDMWVARHGEECAIYATAEGRDGVAATFARYVPPRLATLTDRTGEMTVLRLAGPAAGGRGAAAGIDVPDPGQAGEGSLAGTPYRCAVPPGEEPFALQLVAPAARAEELVAALEATGVVRAGPAALELARVLAGWPQLGAEIGEKTLPQEVRFDELEGVSYTKGCYTGQETVARLHFRGHANWRLAGFWLDDAPDPANAAVRDGEKEIGRLTSVAWLERVGRYLGLGNVRHEIEANRTVIAAGVPARIDDLPFKLPA